MPEPMRKRRTRNTELHFTGPVSLKKQAVEALKSLGFIELSSIDEAVPWREAFPEVKDADLPGTCLRGARAKEGLSQEKLSELTGIPQRHISEMENGKRPIGKKNAKIFAEVLNIDYRILL